MKRARVLALTALLALPTWAALAQQSPAPAQAPAPAPAPAPSGPQTAPAEATPPTANENAEGSSVVLVRKGKDGKECELGVFNSATDTSGEFAICTLQHAETEDATTLFMSSETR